MLRTSLLIVTLVFVLSHCTSKDDSLILGEWKIVEYWSNGQKHTSSRYIKFNSDGTYQSYGDDLHEASGEWRIKNDVLTMHQPEIKDMHGDRSVEPFTRVWNVTLAKEWMMMEGTSKSNTQDMKLVLQKNQADSIPPV
jgi:hypothetical protein